MCGITGWVDWNRDLRDERPVLAAMTATMSCRGPDDEGMVLARHAAIGHRRLAVRPEALRPAINWRDPGAGHHGAG